MKLVLYAILASFVLNLTSCASSYKPIDPESLNYRSVDKKEGVSFEYKYDVLKKKKYQKKEKKKGVQLVAVKVTNTTTKDLVFGKDIKPTFENGSSMQLMEVEQITRELNQKVGFHLFYLLLTPMTFNTYSTQSQGGFTTQEVSSSTPIGLVVGPGLALLNILVGSSANKKFKTELEQYHLYGKTIPAGQTVHGILGVRSNVPEGLKIEVIGSGDSFYKEYQNSENP